jgi:hypothetical protein
MSNYLRMLDIVVQLADKRLLVRDGLVNIAGNPTIKHVTLDRALSANDSVTEAVKEELYNRFYIDINDCDALSIDVRQPDRILYICVVSFKKATHFKVKPWEVYRAKRKEELILEAKTSGIYSPNARTALEEICERGLLNE